MNLDEFWRSIEYPSVQESEYSNSTLYELLQAKEKSGHAALVFAKAYFDRKEYAQCKGELAALAARLEKDTDQTYAGYDTTLFCRVLTLCGHFRSQTDNIEEAQAYYLRAMLLAEYPPAMRALLSLSPELSDGIFAEDSFTLNGVTYTKKSYATALCSNAGVGSYLAMILFAQGKEKSVWVCIAAEIALINSYSLTEDELVEVWYMLALNNGMDLLAGELAAPVTLASLLSTAPPFNPAKYCAGILLENGDVETLQMRLKEGRALCTDEQLQVIECFCADKERREAELERLEAQSRFAKEAKAAHKAEQEAKQAASRAHALARKIEEEEARKQQEKEDAVRYQTNQRHAKEREEVSLRKREKARKREEATLRKREEARKRDTQVEVSQNATKSSNVKKSKDKSGHSTAIKWVILLAILILLALAYWGLVVVAVDIFVGMWLLLAIIWRVISWGLGEKFSSGLVGLNVIALILSGIVVVSSIG